MLQFLGAIRGRHPDIQANDPGLDPIILQKMSQVMLLLGCRDEFVMMR